jgi:hypothetical protein
MLTLQDYPGRGVPDAADESNIEYRDVPRCALFVVWRAHDEHGKPVRVLVGFDTVKADLINAILVTERAALQAAANANYKSGDTEVVLFAPATLAPVVGA